MGVVRTIKGDDGKPYISLEDLIGEVEEARNFSIEYNKEGKRKIDFVEIILSTLHNMEKDYYEKYLFRRNDDEKKDNDKL